MNSFSARVFIFAVTSLVLMKNSLQSLAEPQQGIAETPVDLVLTHGRIWTADDTARWAEAVAIHGNRIVYVGSSQNLKSFIGAKTESIDLGGRLVVPGFNDAHIHLVSGALSLERVDLIEAQSLEAVQALIRDFAAANLKRPWVLGRGWLYGSFAGGLPAKEQLDAVVSDRPAYMECYDGHSGWANSNALALAGITRETKDPENGVIVRDPKTGEPTGALKEAATALIEAKIPKPDAETRYQLFLRALQLLNSKGITSVQDAGYPSVDLQNDLLLFERAKREGRLTLRITAAVQMNEDNYASAIAEASRLQKIHHDAFLRFGAMKGFVDGVIEAHTAAMLEPYSDDPAFSLGLPNWQPENLNAAVVAADKAGLQIYLHAIGDRGVRMALDAHGAALQMNGQRDRRGRIEHIETIAAADYPRFKNLGVIASMQPLHANPDQNNVNVWSRNAGPDRAFRGFGWGNLEKAGARLVFGSDWPVVTPEVFRGLYCAVTRKTKDGTPAHGWLPELAVSIENALRHYTIDAAYASFEEKEKGSIAVGKLADMIVLSEDLFNSSSETILQTRVLLTVMDGKIIYREDNW